MEGKMRLLPLLLGTALLAGCRAPAAERPAPTQTVPPVETPAVGLTPAPESDWEGMLADLQPEDIRSVLRDILNDSITPETLAPMVREAMKHPVEHRERDNGDDRVWSLCLTLGEDWQEARVTLCAGLEENLVGLSYPGGPLWVEDAELYQLIRTSMDTAPNIDQGAYEKYGDFIRAHYDGRMAQYNKAVEEGATGWTTSGWELVELSLAAEREDLGLQVYALRKVNFVDPPQLAHHCIAGGAYVDSRLAIHGWDWKLTYLAVVDGEPLAVFYRSGEPDWSGYATRQEFLDMVAASGEPGG